MFHLSECTADMEEKGIKTVNRLRELHNSAPVQLDKALNHMAQHLINQMISLEENNLNIAIDQILCLIIKLLLDQIAKGTKRFAVYPCK